MRSITPCTTSALPHFMPPVICSAIRSAMTAFALTASSITEPRSAFT